MDYDLACFLYGGLHCDLHQFSRRGYWNTSSTLMEQMENTTGAVSVGHLVAELTFSGGSKIASFIKDNDVSVNQLFEFT